MPSCRIGPCTYSTTKEAAPEGGGLSGGRYWDRTSDLFRVREARYRCANRPCEVGTGFEPVYTALQAAASPLGQPTVWCRQSRRCNASGRRDSNPRPSPWQGDALPAELRPHDPEDCFRAEENYSGFGRHPVTTRSRESSLEARAGARLLVLVLRGTPSGHEPGDYAQRREDDSDDEPDRCHARTEVATVSNDRNDSQDGRDQSDDDEDAAPHIPGAWRRALNCSLHAHTLAHKKAAPEGAACLVGDTGIEPVTSSVSGKRATAAPIARGGYGIRTRVYGFAGRCLASRPTHRGRRKIRLRTYERTTGFEPATLTLAR